MAQTAEGAQKLLAKKAGVSIARFARLVAQGNKWCYGCKAWHKREAFSVDASRYDGLMPLCRVHRNALSRARYQPKPRLRFGPLPFPPRGGDKLQARQRINVEVRTGRRAHPNLLPCSDCAHVYRQGERRHEYDHYLGYSAKHHYDVEPVCTICHRRRAVERGEVKAAKHPAKKGEIGG